MTKIIGLTGGIGSGNYDCKSFSIFGIPVYIADDKSEKLITNA
jgi:dephospho-CoA kinase